MESDNLRAQTLKHDATYPQDKKDRLTCEENICLSMVEMLLFARQFGIVYCAIDLKTDYGTSLNFRYMLFGPAPIQIGQAVEF